ncbi:Imm45 family immunity protein [Pseudomonas sp. LS1212]|uniref:Imm45 family immunity protein n=1 Tax=Pseudomonas sp. LS1212 TaxID=2972478 RepID=UPI00215CC551|nr:Imm45 family immunity protein [Pseudomonas sp. LS1212]UVJ42906.1 Imm45 family immunity protein [Pseudomonas sp. LS1212]
MGEYFKLIAVEGDFVLRGSILRVPGKWPYEKCVDFMIFETQDEDRPYGLMISSGYKAGLILIRLPKEGCLDGGGVSKAWLISNWDKWVYPDCDVADVYLIDGYKPDSIV